MGIVLCIPIARPAEDRVIQPNEILQHTSSQSEGRLSAPGLKGLQRSLWYEASEHEKELKKTKKTLKRTKKTE